LPDYIRNFISILDMVECPLDFIWRVYRRLLVAPLEFYVVIYGICQYFKPLKFLT